VGVVKERHVSGARKRKSCGGGDDNNEGVRAKHEDSDRMPSPPDTDGEGSRQHQPEKRRRAISPSTYRILKTEPELGAR
jgi:hypothetical protein